MRRSSYLTRRHDAHPLLASQPSAVIAFAIAMGGSNSDVEARIYLLVHMCKLASSSLRFKDPSPPKTLVTRVLGSATRTPANYFISQSASFRCWAVPKPSMVWLLPLGHRSYCSSKSVPPTESWSTSCRNSLRPGFSRNMANTWWYASPYLSISHCTKLKSRQVIATVVPRQFVHPVNGTPRKSSHGFPGTQPRESNGKN